MGREGVEGAEERLALADLGEGPEGDLADREAGHEAGDELGGLVARVEADLPDLPALGLVHDDAGQGALREDVDALGVELEARGRDLPEHEVDAPHVALLISRVVEHGRVGVEPLDDVAIEPRTALQERRDVEVGLLLLELAEGGGLVVRLAGVREAAGALERGRRLVLGAGHQAALVRLQADVRNAADAHPEHGDAATELAHRDAREVVTDAETPVRTDEDGRRGEIGLNGDAVAAAGERRVAEGPQLDLARVDVDLLAVAEGQDGLDPAGLGIGEGPGDPLAVEARVLDDVAVADVGVREREGAGRGGDVCRAKVDHHRVGAAGGRLADELLVTRRLRLDQAGGA